MCLKPKAGERYGTVGQPPFHPSLKNPIQLRIEAVCLSDLLKKPSRSCKPKPNRPRRRTKEWRSESDIGLTDLTGLPWRYGMLNHTKMEKDDLPGILDCVLGEGGLEYYTCTYIHI
jgi:hypothetical protein